MTLLRPAWMDAVPNKEAAKPQNFVFALTQCLLLAPIADISVHCTCLLDQTTIGLFAQQPFFVRSKLSPFQCARFDLLFCPTCSVEPRAGLRNYSAARRYADERTCATLHLCSSSSCYFPVFSPRGHPLARRPFSRASPYPGGRTRRGEGPRACPGGSPSRKRGGVTRTKSTR